MTQWKWVSGGLVLFATVALAKDPTIKDVMDRLHKGSSPLGNLKRDLQEDDPPWSEIQNTTRQFVTLGAFLAKNDPPKGDKESWARLAKQYFDNAKAMDAAAQQKDKSGTLAARERLAGSCTGCHKAHRPS